MKTPLTASDDALGTGSSESSDDLLPQLSALGTNGNPTSWSTSTLRVESERTRRLAIARKLTPYQRDLVDEYVNVCIPFHIFFGHITDSYCHSLLLSLVTCLCLSCNVRF